jgi:WD40 repeat protein
LGAVLLENNVVQSLAFAPQGGILAIASDHRVTLIDVPSLNIIQKMDLTPKGVYCLAFSPDGRYLARGAAEKRVQVWNLLGEVN